MATSNISQSVADGPVIWLVSENTTEPYLHKVDDVCDCKTCESKKSLIIKPV